MGQFALGIRSLLIKSAVFVVMAALLAWALGGTLFPRPSRAELESVGFFGNEWRWRLSVYDRRAFSSLPPEEAIQWELVWNDRDKELHVLEGKWVEVTRLVAKNGKLHFGGRTIDRENYGATTWHLCTIDDSRKIVTKMVQPNRLAVELQLSRLSDGLPLADGKTIDAQRQIVLDPQPKTADEGR